MNIKRREEPKAADSEQIVTGMDADHKKNKCEQLVITDTVQMKARYQI